METVKVLDDSRERVAYELMQLISRLPQEPPLTTREEALKLYRQCLLVVHGNEVSSALKEKQDPAVYG